MDIVSRLKQFISYLNIPVTQFADLCKIPRPTLSQLLNGRNKKISDEILRKLHYKYPILNILWLLYGEGNMLLNNNSIPLKSQNPINFTDDSSEKNLINKLEYPNSEAIKKIGDNNASLDAKETISEHKNKVKSEIDSTLDLKKKIVNIIVYYSDNSFESFIPDGKGIS